MSLKPTIKIKTDDEGIHCDVHWSGEKLDRPHTSGYLLGRKKMKLALRFKRAVEAGAIYSNPKIVKDVNGKTYVQAEGFIMARHMNAELKKRGFQ